MNFFTDRKSIRFLAKFLLSFCILYYGTIALIGLATPGNYYSSFVDNYLDYYRWLRSSLMHAAKFSLSIVGYSTEIIQPNYLRMVGGRGVKIGYDCLGYGVVSFWLAFVFANDANWKRKVKWMIGGSAALWIINVGRICLILVGTNKGWRIPFSWNNHTWFNMVAYGLIFFMIFMYDRKHKRSDKMYPVSQ